MQPQLTLIGRHSSNVNIADYLYIPGPVDSKVAPDWRLTGIYTMVSVEKTLPWLSFS